MNLFLSNCIMKFYFLINHQSSLNKIVCIRVCLLIGKFFSSDINTMIFSFEFSNMIETSIKLLAFKFFLVFVLKNFVLN